MNSMGTNWKLFSNRPKNNNFLRLYGYMLYIKISDGGKNSTTYFEVQTQMKAKTID